VGKHVQPDQRLEPGQEIEERNGIGWCGKGAQATLALRARGMMVWHCD
jgi:hypothetical protein